MKETHSLKLRGWKKIYHANGNDKKARVTMLVADNIVFKTKAIKKDKEGHYIIIKRSIQEEVIRLISIYASRIGSPKFIKQILSDIKGEIDKNYNNSKRICMENIYGKLYGGSFKN